MAIAKYSDWTTEELEGELDLRRDQGDDATEIEAEIRLRGGNPDPSPADRDLIYQANQILRAQDH